MRMEDYFANILHPFVASVINNIKFLNDVKIEYIFTAHGLCFRGKHV